jgi:hypothetical protein
MAFSSDINASLKRRLCLAQVIYRRQTNRAAAGLRKNVGNENERRELF